MTIGDALEINVIVKNNFNQKLTFGLTA